MATAMNPQAPHDGNWPADPGDDQQAWAELLDAACAPYRRAGRFAWHWAHGKLGRDPVFRGMLQRGDLPAHARVVDIGCGQGLLASLLMACEQMQQQQHHHHHQQRRWPASWPQPASASAYTGIELMASDIERARLALAEPAAVLGLRQLPTQHQDPLIAPPQAPLQIGTTTPSLQPKFVCADMREAALPACDVVVILDVLHYVDHAAQDQLLQKVHGALPAGTGRLLLRVGDAEAGRAFAISQWVDRVVTLARGHRVPPTWGRALPRWQSLLVGLGFDVRCIPQSQGTPFANVLLVADKRA